MEGRCYLSQFVPAVDGHVVLESVQYRGQHVGVLPSGEIKDPGRTGTGQHAQFILNVHQGIKVSLTLVKLHKVFSRYHNLSTVFVKMFFYQDL